MWINRYKSWIKNIWKKDVIKNIVLFQSSRVYIKNPIYINFKTCKNIFEEINKNIFEEINIYDKTYSQSHKEDEIINVGDHINQTGSNPLIGNQHKLKKQFIDISKLYASSNGITTTCLGNHYEKHKTLFKYPSTHLSHIAITAKALGKNKINGFLVNSFS